MQRKSRSKWNECIEAAHCPYTLGILLIDLGRRWKYKKVAKPEGIQSVSKVIARGYEANLDSLTPGEWYLRYVCPNCRSKHVLFRDLTRGVGQIRATYLIECPGCGNRVAYDSGEIERYHHTTERVS